MKIFLDAGHGGRDTGAVHGSRQEKNDVLRLALALGSSLTSRGIECNYSRTSDVFVGLSERARMANNWGANYFLSIHRNSAIESATGVETWIYSKASKHTTDYGLAINNAVVSGIGLVNRGVKKGLVGNPNLDYAVNRETIMPSALAEVGFISNDSDNNFFDSRFNNIVISLTNGILHFVQGGKEQEETHTNSGQINLGSMVRVKDGARDYDGRSIADFVYTRTYKVDELIGDRAVLDLKGLRTAFHLSDLILA